MSEVSAGFTRAYAWLRQAGKGWKIGHVKVTQDFCALCG